MRKWTHLLFLFTVAGLLLSSEAASAQQPQAAIGTAFSYQGYLKWNGSPANGLYDFSFHLYAEEGGVTPVGSAVEVGDVQVTDGLFNIQLDFGAAPFTGEARWMQISVRPGAETGTYITLTPLRQILPVPYSIYSTQAGSVDWQNVLNRPAGLDDGDNDTQYSVGGGLVFLDPTKFGIDPTYQLPQTCTNGQVAKWQTSTSTWICAVDDNTIFSIGSGLQWVAGVISLQPSYKLPQGCLNGYTAKWNTSTLVWDCAADIDTNTTYTAGVGIELVGGSFRLITGFRLPQSCLTGEVAKWNGSAWICAADDNTTYTAGTGIEMVGGAFQLIASYRLPQGCSSGDIAKWISGAWTCAADNDTTYTAGDGIDITTNIVSAEGTPYQQVVIVAKSGGDYTSIQTALNSITDASYSKRYLVWVAPGVYNETVTMKPWVDIQGAGQEITHIQFTGFSNYTTGVVMGASNAALRDLSVKSFGLGYDYATAIYVSAASPNIERVTVYADLATNTVTGLNINTSSSPLIEDLSITCNGSNTGSIICVMIQDTSGPILHDITMRVQADHFSYIYGIYALSNSFSHIDDLRITLVGSDGYESEGIYLYDNFPDGIVTSLYLKHFEIHNDVNASSNGDLGINNQSGILNLEAGSVHVNSNGPFCKGLNSFADAVNTLRDTDIFIYCPIDVPFNAALVLDTSSATARYSRLDGGISVGALVTNGASLDTHQTQIVGRLFTINTMGPYNIRLADTQLDGGPMLLTGPMPICAGMYDEAFVDYPPGICPP